MIDYIKGEIAELNPTYVVLDVNGIGYQIHITLTEFSNLNGHKQAKLFIHEAIREDAHLLYGFRHQFERHLFLLLMSVSGVGAATARMIMSSYSAQEIQEMIAFGNATALNSVKGIGAKTAQRIIVDLKDKVAKLGVSAEPTMFANPINELRDEAVSAMVMLGFAAAASQKTVDKILKENPALKVEQIIKLALKMM